MPLFVTSGGRVNGHWNSDISRINCLTSARLLSRLAIVSYRNVVPSAKESRQTVWTDLISLTRGMHCVGSSFCIPVLGKPGVSKYIETVQTNIDIGYVRR